MDKVEIIKGQIKKWSNGEEDVLKVGGEILAEQFQNLLDKYGKLVTVRYYTSDKKIASLEKAQEEFLKRVMGFTCANYHMHYSEVTGYLWTDENLNVGGHNLLAELSTQVGKYLLMEVIFHDANAYQLGIAEARKVAVEEIQGLKKTLEFHMKAPGLGKDATEHLQTGLNTLTEASSVVNFQLERLERNWR